MDSTAMSVKNVRVCNDQSYEWGIVEAKYGKVKRHACIDYFWHGPEWRRVVEAMKGASMPASSMSFYKGAQFDMLSRTVRVRGEFVRAVVSDKHRAFWRMFFKCPDKIEPTFVSIGKIVKMPNIAGDNDSLNFIVDGQNVNEILSEPNAEDAA